MQDVLQTVAEEAEPAVEVAVEHITEVVVDMPSPIVSMEYVKE